ncbi:hypothetical protein EDD65_11243 [Keratinibaculum paraultunense]|uniref:Uncharacterized protein n=1 Tax=Keratinibaculum paraultunense TaxID=1278232 RepID=A0A4R3KQF5_9FIRM|nr:hypothetical protein [Keratinibaculum paraultunense]QQY79661.1 hypothetical protein JL105_10850 [Keratinibaculum paraultunense]TCS87085.1 hypothetical protein EDD65_11243 [Keratinibaculum paraultunense]
MEYISIILIAILFTIFNTNINVLQRDQKRIELKLDRIIEHLGLPEPSKDKINDELKDELIKLIEADKKVKRCYWNGIS